MVCMIFISRLGIEPMPPHLEAQSLNQWTTREIPERLYFNNIDKCLMCTKYCVSLFLVSLASVQFYSTNKVTR